MPDSKKQFTIATAIPYLNAGPHIGQALEFIYADVIARYHHAFLQKDTQLITGADEHGQKIARSAEAVGVSPKEYVDGHWKEFQKLHRDLQIGDRILSEVRTHSPEHQLIAQALWERVYAAGFIEQREYEGLYCVGCEEFKTETDLVDGLCPSHKAAPELVRETNYFFLLSSFGLKINEYLESGSVLPYPGEITSFLRDHILEDVSISRSKSKLSWGIPVPNDDSQVMYVWFDALSNYLTGTGVTPAMIRGEEDLHNSLWPIDSIVIGKDINRFHSVLFIAMLIAADLPLPKQILVHGHITVDGQKMSKSIGNVIDPFDLIKKFGAESTRYLLMSMVPFGYDGDVSWEKLQKEYDSELQNGLGNFFSRVTNMVEGYFDGRLVPVCDTEAEKITGKELEKERIFPDLTNEEISSYLILRISSIIKHGDVYLSLKEPWKLIKNEDNIEEVKKILQHCLFLLDLSVKEIKPIMPEVAQKIHDIVTADVIRKPEVGLFPRIEL